MAAVLEGGKGAELNTDGRWSKKPREFGLSEGFFRIHNLAHTSLGFTCFSVLQHVKCLNEWIIGTVNCA